MKLVWHIVKKDFRRLAVPLALWAVLLVARGEVGAHLLRGQGLDPGRLFFYWWTASTMLLWLDTVVCVVLVASLVHEDTLVGTGIGWATRPISGGRLLAAKLLGAVLMFGVLPMLVAVRWWLVCGYGAAEMARAALAIADAQFVTVFGALLLAVLTKNMNHFLAWLLGFGLASIAWVFVLSRVVKGLEVELTRGANETRVVFFLALVSIGGALTIAVQFLTRQREQALRVVAVTVGLLAIIFISGGDFSGRWAHAPRSSLLAHGITVAVENPRIERQGAMDFVVRGVPENRGVMASAEHVWRWSDGAIAAASSGVSTGSWPGNAKGRFTGPHDGNIDEWMMQALVAYVPKDGEVPDASIVPVKFLLWADKAARLRTEPASYTGELHVAFLRPTLEFELPVREGEQRKHAGASVRIERAAWSEGQWRVTLVESRPAGLNDGRARLSVATLVANETQPATGFVLVNRARGEAVKLAPGGMPPAKLVIGTQELSWLTWQCELPGEKSADQPDAPPAWLQGATLVVVRYPEAARFDREVKIKNFGAPAEGAAAK